MVVIDKELIGEGSEKEFQYPNVPLGIFLENQIRENIERFGDSTWMVQ